MSDFKFCSVLITGANRGIGLEFVKQFLTTPSPPEKIFATCRDPEGPQSQELKKLAEKHPSIIVVQLDSTNPESINSSVKEVTKHLSGQRLDLLINNAGILKNNNLESENREDMLEVYAVNVVGPMLVTQAYLSLMKRAEGKGFSAIVHISGILGCLDDVRFMFAEFPAISYRCSKTALNMLSRCQSLVYKKDGIITICIHPGWVKTDLGTDKAPLTKEDSISAVMKVIYSLNLEQNGTFVDWQGKTIPW